MAPARAAHQSWLHNPWLPDSRRRFFISGGHTPTSFAVESSKSLTATLVAGLTLVGFVHTSGYWDVKVEGEKATATPTQLWFNWFFHTSLTNYGQNTNQGKIVGACMASAVAVYKGWQVWPGSIELLSPAVTGLIAGLSAAGPSGLIILPSLTCFSDPRVIRGACC